MMKLKTLQAGLSRTVWILLLITASLGLILTACSPTPTTVPVTPTAEPVLEQPTATFTPELEPSPTAPTGKVLLIAPEDSSIETLTAALSEQASQAGLTFEALADIQPDALTPGVKVVVLLSAPANLADLLAAAPHTQFAVTAATDLPPAANLSVIRLRPENQAFLAGFLGVLLSNDWRAAGLIPSDGPLGGSLQEAFINGGRYFCGTCAPGWPLGVYYPLAAALPSATDGPSWQAAAAGLFDNQKVDVFYLSPEAARDEVIAYLQGKDQSGIPVRLLGAQPAPVGLKEQWAGTIRFDVAGPLLQLIPDLLASQGGQVVDAPLALEDINTQVLGSGRVRLVEELLAEMEAGRIHPFSIPRE